MARNREPVKPVEPQSSGEEEDEDASSEETDSQESDSEPEQTLVLSQKPTPKKSQPQIPQSTPHKLQQPHSSSDEDEESGSESDSESDSTLRPLVSKPTEKTLKSSNGVTTPTKSGAAKRPAEDTPATGAKKKKTVEAESSQKKPNLFQRLWSEDDEIAILQGMIDYYSKKKVSAYADLDGFHDFIKSNLQTNFTRSQLQDKMRRLKKKYVNNQSKEKEGKERTLSNPHEQRAYELSKIVWEGFTVAKVNSAAKVVGGAKANGSVVSKTVSKKVNEAKSEEVKDVKNAMIVSGEGDELPERRLNHSSSGATPEERMLVAGSDLFEGGLGLQGKEEWEKLRVEEFQLYLKQLELRTAQTKLVLKVMTRGDH